MKNLIMIPYAFLQGVNTGVNIGKVREQRDIYMKNCCVSCISARMHNDESTDVALVTNAEVPEPYRTVLMDNGVKIIDVTFDCFDFGGKYRWSLAFYKLCALNHASRWEQYDRVAYMDSDVYVQGSFEDVWKECDARILLYDINHGLGNGHYCEMVEELQSFDNQMGGHFQYTTAANFLQPAVLTQRHSPIAACRSIRRCWKGNS